MEENQKLPPPVTAKDIGLILRRRFAVALFTFVLVVAATLFATSKMPTVYEAKARVLLDRPTDGTVPSNVLDLVMGRGRNPLATEIEKIKSRSFLGMVLEKADLPAGPDQTEDLDGRLKLAASGDQIIDIKVRARTAEEARKLADAVATVYIASAQAEYNQKIDVSQERLVNARIKAKEEKDAADAALNAFNSKLGISDPTALFRERADLTVQTRRQLEEEQKNQRLQEANLLDLKKQLERIPRERIEGYSLNKNSVIDGYKAELYALQAHRKKMLFDYQPDSDEVKDLDVQIKAKQDAIAEAEKEPYSVGSKGVNRNPDYSKIQSAIHDTVLGIEQGRDRIAATQKRMATLEEEQKRLTEQQNIWEGLKRKRDGANEIYEQARLGLIKMDATRLMSAPVIKVLESARLPREPISPKPLLNAIMAVCLGLFLGGGLALLAEYMAAGSAHHDLYDPDLPRIGGVPLLGSVPVALPAPTGSVGLPAPLTAGADTVTLDSLREIGFSLAHRRRGEPVPVILFSGTRSDETSAALAAQLSATLVRDGLRVTLVDADRKHPRLNRVFGKPDAPGLADVLAGRVKARDIIYRGADGNLRFLAAGDPDDPTTLTEAGLRTLFKELSTERDTDIVVVSGPTVWHAPLIAPLEKAATGMVLVAPETVDGPAPAESVARARRLLSNGYQPRVLGVVVGHDARSFAHTTHSDNYGSDAGEENRL